jgi:AcrR family transcriptional regulator
MPRSSVAAARKTRESIVNRAVDVASVDGLEGLTIGRLAGDLAMSKAGVIGHFGSKTELQLAALDQAGEVFREQVWEPAAKESPGLERLLSICDHWIDHIARSAFPGGCFFTAASIEYDARDGVVHERVQAGLRQWRQVLRREVKAAVANGELPAETDPDQVVFELQGLVMGLNQAVQLFDDRRAPARARRAVRRILDL